MEVYSPSTGDSCVLPSLPDERDGHTSDGLTICGGWYTLTTCITFTSGEWVTSHALAEERAFHCSWSNKDKIFILGGSCSSANTSETLAEGELDGVPGFSMKYRTM